MEQKEPVSLDKHNKIEVYKIAKLRDAKGQVGLAKLVYTGYNPFKKRKTKGLSLHNEEGEMKAFVYLSYFDKLAKKYMPSKCEIRSWDKDEELSYKRGDLKEILKITKNMHDNPEKNDFITKNIYDCPEGDDFKYIIDGRNREGQEILEDIMKIVLYNSEGPNIIMKDKGSFIIRK
jgi:hypothetical protein